MMDQSIARPVDHVVIPGGMELAVWRHGAPAAIDLPMQEELFPAARYRYILWDMGFPDPLPSPVRRARCDARHAGQIPLAERTV